VGHSLWPATALNKFNSRTCATISVTMAGFWLTRHFLFKTLGRIFENRPVYIAIGNALTWQTARLNTSCNPQSVREGREGGLTAHAVCRLE